MNPILTILFFLLLFSCRNDGNNCIFPNRQKLNDKNLKDCINFGVSNQECEIDFDFNYWFNYDNGSPIFRIKGKIKKENNKIIIKDMDQQKFILFSFVEKDSLKIKGYFYHGNSNNSDFQRVQKNYTLINEGFNYNGNLADTIHKLRFKGFGTSETGIDLVFLVGIKTGPIGCYEGEKYNNEEYYISFIGDVDTSKLVKNVLE